ncbi:MAG: hypothetical protein LBK53_00620 [Heliobacteriaceae bacterium]|nr:hypothetical protein [Heliobacteriaceae bacterium]
MSTDYSLGIRPSFGMALKNTEVLADIVSRSPKGKKIAEEIQQVQSRQANNPVVIRILKEPHDRFVAFVIGDASEDIRQFELISGDKAQYFKFTKALQRAEKYADKLEKKDMKAEKIKKLFF